MSAESQNGDSNGGGKQGRKMPKKGKGGPQKQAKGIGFPHWVPDVWGSLLLPVLLSPFLGGGRR